MVSGVPYFFMLSTVLGTANKKKKWKSNIIVSAMVLAMSPSLGKGDWGQGF